MNTSAKAISPRGSPTEVEAGNVLMPKFDADGLIPAIVADAASGAILMFAWMNAEALSLTIESRIAHFWTRSRRRIWQKGEESGNQMHVVQMKTDCDQDVILLRVRVAGGGVACHTGASSCFYREVALDGFGPRALRRTDVPAA